MSHISPSGRQRARTYEMVDQTAPNGRCHPEATIAVGGSLLKLRAAEREGGLRGGGRRGTITGFSKAARRRLLDLFASIKRAAVGRLPLFVTLTYPANWPADSKVWKRHLDTWLKRLDRAYSGCAAVWKLEFQSRGAPHFHLLLFGVPFINRLWLSRTWFQVVGSGDVHHLAAGTQVKRVKSWGGVMHYAAKYVAKETHEPGVDAPGRFWGVFRRERLPIELVTLPLTFQQFFKLRRLICRWGEARKRERGKGYVIKRGSAWQGCKVYAENATTWQFIGAIG